MARVLNARGAHMRGCSTGGSRVGAAAQGRRIAILVFAAGALLHAQTARLRPAPLVSLPAPIVDGNSPAFWDGEVLKVFTSSGLQMAMRGANLFSLVNSAPPVIDAPGHYPPLWIEGIWRDEDGTVYAWYHHEADGGCAYRGLMTPMIGALISYDGGETFHDLGIILSSGSVPNCLAANGYFAGGHGDFSVILDTNRRYFYFLFTNYGGPEAEQGVAMARMAFEDRANPAGAVYKFYEGEWTEPGIGGRVTPVLPAAVSWDRLNTDSFWGPAVHWNTYLRCYVILLNRACCKARWPQEGVYVSFTADLSDPASWKAPAKISYSQELDFFPGYYPQAFGMEVGESDTRAGEVARFFLQGTSKWEIIFSREPDPQPWFGFMAEAPPEFESAAPDLKPAE